MINNTTLGNIPSWLQDQVKSKKENLKIRTETEVKFILPKAVFFEVKEKLNLPKQDLEQIYLSEDLTIPIRKAFDIISNMYFKEWRIRRIDGKYCFTAKGAASEDGTSREEIEKEISMELFYHLKEEAMRIGKLNQIEKTRYTFETELAGERVKLDIDDYHAATGKSLELDFVSCEVEVEKPELAKILLNGRFFSPDLIFLKQGRTVVNVKEFSNRYLSEFGFVADRYDEVIEWLIKYYSGKMENALNDLRNGKIEDGVETAQDALTRIKSIVLTTDIKMDSSDIGFTQNTLEDLAFNIKDSFGRKDKSNSELKTLDSYGKGWLRDYHEIISADFYIRLNSKPQIFRPGLGYTNTTTRGAHTSDVIACSMQLARQLGLNSELCIAIAALHDVGHPAGGHKGEEIIEKISGRKFEHHIFSLSLADIFNLNLLMEVQTGAFYHKSSGGELVTPKGKPQEFGIVRVADKISYCPWDFFDSLQNGYLKKEEVPQELFKILGQEPIEWIHRLVRAVVRESAEAHQIQFTKKSGELYEAYLETKSLVKNRVHENIDWKILEAQMVMCYDKITNSFPGIADTVPILGYMTDIEIGRLTSLIESQPHNTLLSLEDLKKLGFGFYEIIEKMMEKDFEPSMLYYNSSLIDWEI